MCKFFTRHGEGKKWYEVMRKCIVLTEGNPFIKEAKGKIKPAFMNLCSVCGNCAATCSKGAITIN